MKNYVYNKYERILKDNIFHRLSKYILVINIINYAS